MLDRSIPGAEAPPSPVARLLRESRYFRMPRSRLVAAGAPLFAEGLQRGRTARIAEGGVCLYQRTADDGRRILDILGPGHLVGPYLTDLGSCDVTALTRTRLVAVDPAEEAARVAGATRRMLLRAQSQALLLRRNAVSERVASGLLDLAAQFTPGGDLDDGATFRLHVTRGDLADWLGLTLTSVSRGLNAFKRAGVIAFDRPKVITIRDRARLEMLASGAGEPARKRLP